MSFTPQRVQPPPGAWERPPTTPFELRCEGQKIWKQIPLQDLGGESTGKMSRREDEERENNLRTTEKLRLGTVGSGGAAEECACTSSAAAGTKWQTDNFEHNGSPKKKLCSDVHDPETMAGHFPFDQEVVIDEVVPSFTLDVEGISETEMEVVSKKKLLQSGAADPENTGANTHDTSAFNPVLFAASSNEDDDTERPEFCRPTVDDNAAIESKDAWDVNDTTVSRHIALNSQAPATLTQRLFSFTQRLFGQSLPVSGVETVHPDAVPLSPSPPEGHHRHDSVPGLSLPNPVTTIMPANLTLTHTTPVLLPSKHEEKAFLRDFLERTQASKAARIPSNPLEKPSSAVEWTIKAEPTAADIQIPGYDSDDSSTIVARVEPTPDIQSPGYDSDDSSTIVVRVEPTPTIQDPGYDSDDSSTIVVRVEPTPTIQDPESDSDDSSTIVVRVEPTPTISNLESNTSSSTHRSARTAVWVANSRLPRLRAPSFGTALPSRIATTPLPGTIQPRRATGNEFVFNAKAQQNINNLTRSNTKRNQGAAAHVSLRLMQLGEELRVRQQAEGNLGGTDLPIEEETGEMVPIAEDSKGKANQKRKRAKRDTSKTSKRRRTIQWPSDELLASYREPSSFITESEAEEAIDDTIEIMPITSAESARSSSIA